ncbi:protoheme IX farnesyltransferase [Hazenella sp. IB182357]|uniref:Protoheme IX farnesyltransferase n=1 Tax=Polycladospora coralii TaxID=2771432 RepID=A0A926RYC5_9BACL|nr:heme o synthase [Polycladospora coralii]MBD1373381.1 protoheme IX farnesyltransferase [Polycladospora coralii]
MERSFSQQTSADRVLTTTKATWRDYIDITKPGINKSNLFAAFTGYWLATGFTELDFLNLLMMLLGSALVIAGGCTLNNYIDRDIDPKMERTHERAIVQGRIKPNVALWYGIILTILGVLTLSAINLLTAVLGMFGFVVYVFIYTIWLKRTSTHNTLIGSFSGAVPPLIGWAAATGELSLSAWALFLILFLWQPPHFFAIAMRKVDDYRAAGIPMLPVVKGFYVTKVQTLIYTILLVPSSFILYFDGASSWFYLVIAAILGLIYIVLAIKGFFAKDEAKWVNQMFFYSLIYLTVILLAVIVDKTIVDLLNIY